MAGSENTKRALSPGLIPWKPGQSGNPGGRPRGIERQLREKFGPDLPAIFAALRDKALDGDVNAAKLFLDRILGPVKERLELSRAPEEMPTDELEGHVAEVLGIGVEKLRLLRAVPVEEKKE